MYLLITTQKESQLSRNLRMQAQRWRCSAPTIINPGGRWGWVVNATCRPIYPGIHCTGGWRGLGAALDRWGDKIHCPHGRSNPKPSGPQQVAIPTTNFLEDDINVNSGIRTKLSEMNLRTSPQRAALQNDHCQLHYSEDSTATSFHIQPRWESADVAFERHQVRCTEEEGKGGSADCNTLRDILQISVATLIVFMFIALFIKIRNRQFPYSAKSLRSLCSHNARNGKFRMHVYRHRNQQCLFCVTN
jgi:hypothetical protein